MMFTAEKTMFRPPGDVSQAARILGKNNVWCKCAKMCGKVCKLAKMCKQREGGLRFLGRKF